MQNLILSMSAHPVQVLHRLRCLIVEDQTLIGMSLEDYLEDLGYDVAGSLTSCAAALAWLGAHTPDLAILDYMLDDGSCLELARELQRRSVPFLVYSGLSRGPDTPPEFQDVPWLEKPTARAEMLEAIERLALTEPNLTTSR